MASNNPIVEQLKGMRLSFGDAIETIKANSNVMMYRKAWHGKQLGKKMGIIFTDTFNDQLIDGIFIFISDERRYAWTPSQHDMMSNDWVITDGQ